MTSPSVRRLAELTETIGEAGDSPDWPALSAAYGHGFPTDYRDFVAAFGEGSFNQGGVMVTLPQLDRDTGWPVDRLPDDTAADPIMQLWRRPEEAGRHCLRDMLLWGETSSADVLCWLTEDPDPDRWPVAVWSRGEGTWELYEDGMAGFLARLFTAGYDHNPVSTATVWGRPPRFLHTREEARLSEAGLDPWTGEPDPFAGMEYD